MSPILKLCRAGAVFLFLFIVLRPAHSLADGVYFHHFFHSETTGSPVYLSGKLSEAGWSDLQKMPQFQWRRKQLSQPQWTLVVKHPLDQKGTFEPVGLKLYSRGLLPDWIACHLSWPSDLRLQTNPTEPYELHTLSGPIIPGCSQFRSDTDKTIAFVPADDSEPGIYPNGLWLIEIPPLKQVDEERTKDNFGIPEIPNPADLKDLLPGAYGSGPGFGFDFKPGGGGWSNLMDINIMMSLLPTAREERGESRPVLVLGHQEGVSIEVVDARGHQWHRFYTMDEASELLEGIEDGEDLLPRLRGNHWVVKAGKVEDLSSLCRESIGRIVRQAGPGAWFQGDMEETNDSSGNVAEFVVPGAISFNNDKNQKSSDHSGQQSGNKQGSSAQASGTSNTGTASASKVSGGGATGGSGDGQDNEEKPGKKMQSQCEASAIKEVEIQGSATNRDSAPSYQPCKASSFEVRKTIPEESASLIIQQRIQDLEWDIIEVTAETIHLDISKSLTRKQPTQNNASSLTVADRKINVAMVDRRIKKAHSTSPRKLFEFIAETLLDPLLNELENKSYFLEVEGSIESLHLTWYTSPFVGQHIRSGDMPESLEGCLITLDLTGVAPEDTDSALLAVKDNAIYSSPAKKALLMTIDMCTCQALILSHPVHRSALLTHFLSNMVSKKNVMHAIDLFTGLVGTTENIEARVVGGYTGQLGYGEGFHKSFLPALNHHGINIVETFIGNPDGRPMDIIFDPHKNELFRLKISMETKVKISEHNSSIRDKCIRGQHPFSLYTSDNPEHLLQLHLKAK